jgi:hypothetical protein
MKVTRVKTLTKKLNIVPNPDMYERTLNDTLKAQANSRKEPSTVYKPNIWRIVVTSKIGILAVAFLIIFSCATCFVLSRKVTDLSGKVIDLKGELEQARGEIALAATDDSATINLYLREHQDVVARHVSLPATPQPARMRVSQDDILYFEFLDGSEYMDPGIIIRGSSSQQQISSPQAPTIANGHTLTLSEARKTSKFDLVAPPMLYPGHRLDKIRRIDDRDALHLSYTNGIDRISLFEQHLDGERRLVAQDFREYAVYRNKGQSGGTILAWRDDTLSYVLIGNVEMSQLMDMAQSIGAGNERE